MKKIDTEVLNRATIYAWLKCFSSEANLKDKHGNKSDNILTLCVVQSINTKYKFDIHKRKGFKGFNEV